MAGAEGWAGFTQEELRRLQRGTECGRGAAGPGAVRCSQQALGAPSCPSARSLVPTPACPLARSCISLPVFAVFFTIPHFIKPELPDLPWPYVWLSPGLTSAPPRSSSFSPPLQIPFSSLLSFRMLASPKTPDS